MEQETILNSDNLDKGYPGDSGVLYPTISGLNTRES